jgi:hypothetical protein
MGSNVVQFPSVEARRDQARSERLTEHIKTRKEIREKRYADSAPLTETAKKYRMRINRRDVWRDAEAVTRYWRAKMNFGRACESARQSGLQDALSYNFPDDRETVRQWRSAFVRQLLTPAPDHAALAWKQKAFAQNEHEYTVQSRSASSGL